MYGKAVKVEGPHPSKNEVHERRERIEAENVGGVCDEDGSPPPSSGRHTRAATREIQEL
jgi:hypothetical protein